MTNALVDNKRETKSAPEDDETGRRNRGDSKVQTQKGRYGAEARCGSHKNNNLMQQTEACWVLGEDPYSVTVRIARKCDISGRGQR